MPAISSIVAVAAFVVSTVVQIQAQAAAKKRQAKMAAEAAARADEAKGMTFVVDGEAAPLGVAYGRNKIGGVRVYHNTLNAYTHSTASGFTTFQNKLSASQTGTKHEYLILQQALCVGGINAVIGVTIDERLPTAPEFETGLRIDVHTAGGVTSPLATSQGLRTTAKFTNTAYATGVFKLNRDDSQYSGVPTLNFFIEGMKVKTITGTAGNRSLSTTKTYSNNPALCLLDYLLSVNYGRGISINEIDLDSFYAAYLVCERPVKTIAPTGVLLNGRGNLTCKLYECNITLNTSASVRSNIESILETMGMAELVWTAGKYKLNLVYPRVHANMTSYAIGDVVQYGVGANTDFYTNTVSANFNLPSTGIGWLKNVIAAYITDDNIIRGIESSVAWPTAQERLNFVTVRYLNEEKDFSEDSVSWPVKGSVVHNTFMTEDSNTPLESDFFESGITNYVNAIAKAEHRCRMARAATLYKLRVSINYSNLEPGDLIKVTSNVLGIPGEILRIEEIHIKDDMTVDIAAYKFDAAILEWNAADDQIITPRNIYDTSLAQVTNLSVTSITSKRVGASSTLTWDRANDARVSKYIIKYSETPNSLIDLNTEWVTLGETTANSFEIVDVVGGIYSFTVIAASSSKVAPQASWPLCCHSIFGIDEYNIRLYTRSATVPTVPSAIFNFETFRTTSFQYGWSLTPTAGTLPLYCSVGKAVREIPIEDTQLEFKVPFTTTELPEICEPTFAQVGVSLYYDGTLGYSTTPNGEIVFISYGINISKTNQVVYSIDREINCNAIITSTGEYRVTNLTGNKGLFRIKIVKSGVIYYRYISVVAIPVEVSPITNLSLSETLVLVGKIATTKTLVSWTASDAAYYKVSWSTDNITWTEGVITNIASAELFTISVGRVYVKVVGIIESKTSISVIGSIDLQGKTTLPAPPTNLNIDNQNLTWTPNTEVDLWGYEIRYHPLISNDWGSALPLHAGVVTNTPYVIPIHFEGPVTFLVKTIDTSENRSLTAATLSVSFPEKVIANVLYEQPEGPNWLGLKTNCVVSGTDLVADNATNFWNSNGNILLWHTGSIAFWTQEYSEMKYKFNVLSAGLEGSTLFLATIITGATYQIYYTETEIATSITSSSMVWPGNLNVKTGYNYSIELIVSQGQAQGIVSQFTVKADVPDISESKADIAISAAGTRLPLTKTYHAIKIVNLSVRDSGTALFTKVIDKLNTGPLIKCYNASGVAVDGLVDIIVQGY